MELTVEPELYTPSISDNGQYIDTVLPLTRGIRCPCGSRKDKLYTTTSQFVQHTQTKTHQKWLAHINSNKANYYIETEELKRTVQTQRMMIARLEKELQNKNMTIDFLTQQLVAKKPLVVSNLLDFD